MKIKGTIVITDPCYIFPKEPSYHTFLPKGEVSDEEKNISYDKYFESIEKFRKNNVTWGDDRIELSDGSGLKNFGFTNFIWENTIYGDWSCTTFELTEESKDKQLLKIQKSDIKGELGKFCADAGLVGVFLLDEVLNFNPDFKCPLNEYGVEWATVIKDFDGEVEYMVEDVKDDYFDEVAFIRGIGNVNFITMQTGL